MRIGVPAEVKTDEYRVALAPAGALELTRRGHEVWVERGAGVGRSQPCCFVQARQRFIRPAQIALRHAF